VSDPNPIRGLWYAGPREPLPDSPCYGCRRGLRRSYVVVGDQIFHHHLVREGVTIDCIGTGWLIDRWCAEHPECVVDIDDASVDKTTGEQRHES
jgi:hypothetical protein